MNAHGYIADSYAGVLSKGDVIQLFDSLIMTLEGNRSEAARHVEVTYAATYGWKDAKYIKYDTKRKVLAANLDVDFLETTEFLLNRSGERTVEILRTVISTLFTEAMETDSRSLFSDLINKFETVRRIYRGTIRDKLEDEIAEMEYALECKAVELEVPFPKKPISDYTAKELIEVLPLFSMEFKRNPGAPEIAANILKLPVEDIKNIWNAFGSLRAGEIRNLEIYPGITANFEEPDIEGTFILSGTTPAHFSIYCKNILRAHGSTLAFDEEEPFLKAGIAEAGFGR